MKKSILQGIAIFFLSILGTYFNGYSSFASPVWPAIGFAVVFYYYNRSSKYPIIIAVVIANLLGQLLIQGNSFNESIFISLVFSIASIVEILLFPIIIDYIKDVLNKTINSPLVFIVNFIIIALIGSIINLLFMIILYDFSIALDVFVSWFLGDLFGMFIFSTVYIYSKYHKESITKENIKSSILLLLIFSIIVAILFRYAGTYENKVALSILLIPFFIFATVYINFRVLSYLSLLYFALYHVFYMPYIEMTTLFDLVLSLDVTLFLLVGVSILLRDRMLELKISHSKNEKTSTQLSHVLESITNLFEFRSSIDDTLSNFNEEYLEKIFELGISVFDNFDGASCFIEKGEFIHFVKVLNYDKKLLNDSKIPISGFTFEVAAPIHATNAEDSIKKKTKERYKEYHESTSTIKESIYVGFYLNNSLRGGMSFDKFESNDSTFSQDDIEAFSYFQKTVNHLYQESYSLAEEITIKDNVVVGLVRALEVYDLYTKGHSEEVAKLSNNLAKKLGLSNNEISEITYAALLHDIGKIGITQAIINKPSKLSDEEYTVIKGHSKQGYEMIKELPGMESIAEIILNHHERWDGKGYPFGTKGDDISLGSQIISVADAVSTMLSGRPYSLKKTVNEVVIELEKCRGTQFSPIIVEKMISILLKSDEYLKNLI